MANGSMRFLRDVSLKRKLMVIIMLTSSVALLLACAAFVTYERTEFRQDMVDDLTVKAELFAEQSTAALSFKDPKAATEILRKLAAGPAEGQALVRRPLSGIVPGNSIEREGHRNCLFQVGPVGIEYAPSTIRQYRHLRGADFHRRRV